MQHIKRFTVVPKLPERLEPLLDIARNLWWSWNPEAMTLFMRIDPELWDRSRHNPVLLLGRVGQGRLDELAADSIFVGHMDRIKDELDSYVEASTWYQKVHRDQLGVSIAYFSAEFGIHECLPLYSGGLGILAGDHLKSASDLGLPLVSVGLCYRVGYFRQYLNQDGWQQESYDENDFYNLPMTLVRGDNQKPVMITIDLAGQPLHARIWRVLVGRIPLYLLDANVQENGPNEREITNQLYGGDSEMRLKQEMLLGMGGVVALRELGVEPTVYHMNEGHSALLSLERVASLMQNHGLSWSEASEAVQASNVFTTHTPVPAGNDVFTPELFESYMENYCSRVGIDMEQLMALGRQTPSDADEGFCMTVLALKTAGRANGVSKLHGSVSRRMWTKIWPSLPEHELPIAHITNGIHTRSWFSSEIARLYDRYLGPRWQEDPVDHRVWKRVDRIPDSELWRSQERMREHLVALARTRLKAQLERRGTAQSSELASEVLDPEVLTIGFARRFATYKRATLLFQDFDRLVRLCNDSERPMQFIFAGKAHPRDHLGKELIRELVHYAVNSELRRRIVFLEDYDIELARILVQGVDVWLNTPRRPLEASGTSGMKVPVNGGINVSILDGWWVEGYTGSNGWVIGSGEEYEDHEYQDKVESLALYDILEHDVAPTFYRRGADGLPRDWIKLMKASMREVIPIFNTNRMVEDYTAQFYLPASLQWKLMASNEMAHVRELARWKEMIANAWKDLSIVEVDADGQAEFAVGDTMPVTAKVALGALQPDDITVEAVAGALNAAGQMVDGTPHELEFSSKDDSGTAVFRGGISCTHSGRNGFAVRVLPSVRRAASNRFETRLVTWWGEVVSEVREEEVATS